MTEKTEHECPTCDRVFDSLNGMKVHHSKSHGESIAGFEKECENCGVTFTYPYPEPVAENVYCSMECSQESRRGEYVKLNCDYCGTDFERKKSDHENADRKGHEHTFCSADCFQDWRRENMGELKKRITEGIDGGRVEVECAWCGNTEKIYQSDAVQSNLHFCTTECYARAHRDDDFGGVGRKYQPKTVQCDNCGESKEVPGYKAARNEYFFCDNTCAGEWRRTDTDPGLGPYWGQKREQRLEMDDYECVDCGISVEEHIEKYGCSLHIHHIQPRSDFTDSTGDVDWNRANKIDNLITLCASCHRVWEGLPAVEHNNQRTTANND